MMSPPAPPPLWLVLVDQLTRILLLLIACGLIVGLALLLVTYFEAAHLRGMARIQNYARRGVV